MSVDKQAGDSGTGSPFEKQGLPFLHQARGVRDLGTGQIERIARRLRKRAPQPRRTPLWPAWVVLAFIMGGGATYAVAKGGRRVLPIVVALFSSRHSPPLTPPATRVARRTPGQDQMRPEARLPSLPTQPGTEPSLAPNPSSPPVRGGLVAPTKAPIPEQASTAMPEASPLQPKRSPAVTQPSSEPGVTGNGQRLLPTVGAPALVAEDSIVAESRSFALVIESWHREQNANAALVLLDAHERRHPSGQMRLEAKILRAELYLAEGRRWEALAVLDAISVAGIPRTRELLTLRGELRVHAGRCAEARRDLGSVLDENIVDGLAQRAARALARCP
jgi:hypothetical protein